MKLSKRLAVGLILAFIAGIVWAYPYFSNNLVQAHETPAIGGIPGRMNLQICIANTDGSAVKGELMSQIQTTMQDLKKHPQFEAAGLNSGGGAKIRAGCPSKAALAGNEMKPQRVSVAGPILTYVFIVSEEQLSNVAFKHYPRVVGHEVL